LIGALGLAVYLLIGRTLLRRNSISVYVTICYGAAAGFLGLGAISSGQQLVGFTTPTWWCLIALALVSQFLGHTSNNWALQFLSAALVAIALMGEPVCSALLAYALFGETLTVMQLCGAAFVLTGIYLAARAERR